MLDAFIRNNKKKHEQSYADFGDYKVYDREVAREVMKRLRQKHGDKTKFKISEVVSDVLESFAFLSSEKDPQRINKKLHGE